MLPNSLLAIKTILVGEYGISRAVHSRLCDVSLRLLLTQAAAGVLVALAQHQEQRDRKKLNYSIPVRSAPP